MGAACPLLGAEGRRRWVATGRAVVVTTRRAFAGTSGANRAGRAVPCKLTPRAIHGPWQGYDRAVEHVCITVRCHVVLQRGNRNLRLLDGRCAMPRAPREYEGGDPTLHHVRNIRSRALIMPMHLLYCSYGYALVLYMTY